jgi:hypothetical protein
LAYAKRARRVLLREGGRGNLILHLEEQAKAREGKRSMPERSEGGMK